jgi:integrase/recombinase XerD
VRDWLERSGLREGPLFPRVLCNGAVCVSNGKRGPERAVLTQGWRLSATQVNVVAKLASARVAEARGEVTVGGGEGSPAERQRALLAYAKDYSGHSLRVGAARDMAAVGNGTAAILQAGGWKDERMVRRYIRKLGTLDGAVLWAGGGVGRGYLEPGAGSSAAQCWRSQVSRSARAVKSSNASP